METFRKFQSGHRVLGITPEKIGKLAIKKGIPTIIEYFDNKIASKVIKKYGNKSNHRN